MENLNFLPEEERFQAAEWLNGDASAGVFTAQEDVSDASAGVFAAQEDVSDAPTKEERCVRIAKARHRAEAKNSSADNTGILRKDAFKPYLNNRQKDKFAQAWLRGHDSAIGRKAFVPGLTREEKDKAARDWLRQRRDVLGLAPNHKRTRRRVLALELKDSFEAELEPEDVSCESKKEVGESMAEMDKEFGS